MSVPQRTYTTVNGVEVLTREEWHLNGQLHRTDGPAFREWFITADMRQLLTDERWYLYDQRHRTDGPALQEWTVIDAIRVLTFEGWCLNDQFHRTDGPAYRIWNVVDGITVLVLEQWYLQGVRIHPRILRQPVRAIERWWRSQQERRQRAIEEALWDNGMTVFPGFMGLLREY